MMFKCCICNFVFKGYGNNPYPIKDHGRCCILCNIEKVIPARLKKLKEIRNEIEEENEQGFTYCDMEE